MPFLSNNDLNILFWKVELHALHDAHDGGRWLELAVQHLEFCASGSEPVLKHFQNDASKAVSHLQPASQDGYANGCGTYIKQMAEHGDHKRALELASKEAGILRPVEAGTTGVAPTQQEPAATDNTKSSPKRTKNRILDMLLGKDSDSSSDN